MATKKAGQSCWTCKQRKIGCDRAHPTCGNCSRSSRKCQGYNIRLLWPDRPDGRRKVGEVVHSPVRPGPPTPVPRHYGTQFLNVTSDDVVLSTNENLPRDIVASPMMRVLSSPRKSLTPHLALVGREANLLSYYERNISTMISTTQYDNGFRSELLPMALHNRDLASSALCNAMLAVSAHHHQGAAAALQYKADAVRNLMDSLSSRAGSPNDVVALADFHGEEIVDTQIAASMMLCVYSVFDETEGNWHMHLDGAKKMLQRLVSSHNGRVQSSFLLTWFLYHEVLACFTHPLRENPQALDLLQLLQDSAIDKSIIIGSLGCSIEVIEIIHSINRIRAALLLASPPASPLSTSSALAQERLTLEHRLNNLRQTIHPSESASLAPQARLRLLSTADLYRLSAYLYLIRVVPLPSDETLRPTVLTSCLNSLSQLEVATSPWPVFVIACESTDDNARVQLLRILQTMEAARGIGNVLVMRGIVEAFWKQTDLRADLNTGSGPLQNSSTATSGVKKGSTGENVSVRWWDLVNCDPAVPWFI